MINIQVGGKLVGVGGLGEGEGGDKGKRLWEVGELNRKSAGGLG